MEEGRESGTGPEISGSLVPAALVLFRLAPLNKTGKIKPKTKIRKKKRKKKVGLRTGKVARPLELQDVFAWWSREIHTPPLSIKASILPALLAVPPLPLSLFLFSSYRIVRLLPFLPLIVCVCSHRLDREAL